eukprot:231866-Rhodomonas_salina.2
MKFKYQTFHKSMDQKKHRVRIGGCGAMRQSNASVPGSYMVLWVRAYLEGGHGPRHTLDGRLVDERELVSADGVAVHGPRAASLRAQAQDPAPCQRRSVRVEPENVVSSDAECDQRGREQRQRAESERRIRKQSQIQDADTRSRYKKQREQQAGTWPSFMSCPVPTSTNVSP